MLLFVSRVETRIRKDVRQSPDYEHGTLLVNVSRTPRFGPWTMYRKAGRCTASVSEGSPRSVGR